VSPHTWGVGGRRNDSNCHIGVGEGARGGRGVLKSAEKGHL
jgi:hypothetical protein